MEDKEIREDLRGVKRTMEAKERAEEISKREMREDIANLQRGMEGLERKLRNTIEVIFKK